MSISGKLEIKDMGVVEYHLTGDDHVHISTKELNVGPLLKCGVVDGIYAAMHIGLFNGAWGADYKLTPHVLRDHGKVPQRTIKAVIVAIVAQWSEFIRENPELLVDAQIAKIKSDIEQTEEDEVRMHEKIKDMRRQVGKLNWQLDTLHNQKKALLASRNG